MKLKKGKSLCFFSAKGGVGKTINLINLAGIFQQLDKKVLIIDLDLYCGNVANALNKKYDYSILDDVNFGDVSENSFSGGIVDTESSSAEVPTLIYDGPFSDGLNTSKPKALTGEEITQKQAEEIFNSIFTSFY